MWLQLLIKVVLLPYVLSVPLEPGQQGGPWTEEEIDIVREKVQPDFISKQRALMQCTKSFKMGLIE